MKAHRTRAGLAYNAAQMELLVVAVAIAVVIDALARRPRAAPPPRVDPAIVTTQKIIVDLSRRG